eukprot:1154444-Pelagomonas_calceolata.AAC.4
MGELQLKGAHVESSESDRHELSWAVMIPKVNEALASYAQSSLQFSHVVLWMVNFYVPCKLVCFSHSLWNRLPFLLAL